MSDFPLKPKSIKVNENSGSVTVYDRAFGNFLRMRHDPSMTTPAGPIPWDKVKIGGDGTVTVFDESLTSMIDQALKSRDTPLNPAADVEINLGYCNDVNAGSCKQHWN